MRVPCCRCCGSKRKLSSAYAAMTRAFMAKSMPTTKPLALPLHEGASSERRPGDGGKIAELVVIAVRRVVRLGERSRAGPDRRRSSGLWVSSFRPREPRGWVQCSVRYGQSHKLSRVAESSASAFSMDEKFAFGRREGAPAYEQAVIELLAPSSASSTAATDPPASLGHLVIDVEREFRSAESDPSRQAEPIHRSTILESAEGSPASWEIDYVLHRLPVETAPSGVVAEIMTKTAWSIDDDGDLEAFGAAFSCLWYMF